MLKSYEDELRLHEKLEVGAAIEASLAQMDINSFASLILKKPRNPETLVDEKLDVL